MLPLPNLESPQSRVVNPVSWAYFWYQDLLHLSLPSKRAGKGMAIPSNGKHHSQPYLASHHKRERSPPCPPAGTPVAPKSCQMGSRGSEGPVRTDFSLTGAAPGHGAAPQHLTRALLCLTKCGFAATTKMTQQAKRVLPISSTCMGLGYSE